MLLEPGTVISADASLCNGSISIKSGSGVIVIPACYVVWLSLTASTFGRTPVDAVSAVTPA